MGRRFDGSWGLRFEDRSETRRSNESPASAGSSPTTATTPLSPAGSLNNFGFRQGPHTVSVAHMYLYIY
jgi:hypothetical protein